MRAGGPASNVVPAGPDNPLGPFKFTLGTPGYLIHGSNANRSGGPRIGFIVRFVTSQTNNLERQLMQVRGDADCSHLRLAAPPVEEQLAIATMAWQAREPNPAASAGRG